MRGSGARLWTLQATVSHIHTIISGVLSHCASAIPCGHLVLYLWSLDVYSVCVKNPECVTAELLQGKRYVHLTSLAVLTTFRLCIYLLFWGFFSPCVSLCPPALSQFTTMFTLGQRFKGRPRHWRTSHWVGNKVHVGAYKHTSVPSDCQV